MEIGSGRGEAVVVFCLVGRPRFRTLTAVFEK